MFFISDYYTCAKLLSFSLSLFFIRESSFHFHRRGPAAGPVVFFVSFAERR